MNKRLQKPVQNWEFRTPIWLGLFGGKDAKIKVMLKEVEKKSAPKQAPAKREEVKKEEKPATKQQPAEQVQVQEQEQPKQIDKAVIDRKCKLAVDYVSDMLVKMGLDEVKVEANLEDDHLTMVLVGNGVGILIGRRGETLDAIQYLAGLVANKGGDCYLKVTVDSNDYREKRKQTLEALAVKVAKSVVSSGRSKTLEAMNPYERRIIHSAVQTIEGATSKSVGVDPYRKVVISSLNPVKKKNSYSGKGGRDKFSKGDRSKRPYRDKKERKPEYIPDPNAKKIEKSEVEMQEAPLFSKIEL